MDFSRFAWVPIVLMLPLTGLAMAKPVTLPHSAPVPEQSDRPDEKPATRPSDEAGTPPIIEGIGLGAALDYVNALGMESIEAHERNLLRVATERLQRIEGLRPQLDYDGVFAAALKGRPVVLGTFMVR